MTEEKKTCKVKEYVKALPKRFFITAFSGMAQGLFVTLIAGTILAQIAGWIGENNYIGSTLWYIASIAKSLMGAGIGVGIAYALGKNKLLIFSSAVAGMIGAFADSAAVWSLADFAIGAMTLINVTVLCLMSREVRDETDTMLSHRSRIENGKSMRSAK